MLTDNQRRRYARNITLPQIGEEGQRRLLASRVLVVGAGGLGSPCLSYLVAAGVGHVGIAEYDRVELSNLQRQILFETADIGRLKAEAARDRLSELSPDVKVALHTEKLTCENAGAIVDEYDIVADGSDNFATRFAVNAACLEKGKSLVSAALRAWEGQVAVFQPFLGDGQPCYRCFVGGSPDDERGCHDAGVLGAFAGVLGTLQAMEVIKVLLGVGTLTGRLFTINGLTLSSRISAIQRDAACESCNNCIKPLQN